MHIKRNENNHLTLERNQPKNCNKAMTTTANTSTTLTAENFKLETGNYNYNGIPVVITGKITGFGSGKKTVYTGTIDGAVFENWDVCRIKKALGIAVSGTAKGGASIRIMSDDEAAALIDAEYNRAKKLYDNFANFMAKYNFNVGDMAEVEIKDAIDYEITEKVAAARAAKAEAERVAEEKAAEKAAKEALKEAKAADKVRAAKVAQASDLQKQMMDAVLAGDFAKLAELQKLAAEQAA